MTDLCGTSECTRIGIVEEGLREAAGIRLMLRSRSFKVTSVRAGDSVRKMSAEGFPDVVIVGDGCAASCATAGLLKRHRNLGCSSPVLAVVDEPLQMKDGGWRSWADDYVPRPITAEILFIRVYSLLRLRGARERLQREGLLDPVTGSWAAGTLAARMSEEIASTRRHGRKLSCGVLRIDNLRRINSEIGYESGDIVLRKVAETMMRNVRAGDHCARSAGDEFLLVFRDCGKDEADGALARISKDLSMGKFFDGWRSIGVDVACGAAGFDEAAPDCSTGMLLASARAEALRRGAT